MSDTTAPADVIFQGIVYRRAPGHRDRHRRLYYMATTTREYLHRAVWRVANGPIPDGWHVHHVNHDALDNRPENLQALPAFDHLSQHGHEHPTVPTACERCGVEFAARRPWSRWCSARCKQAQRRADGVAYTRPPKGPYSEPRDCEECDVQFDARRPWARFCSPRCKQRASRRIKKRTAA